MTSVPPTHDSLPIYQPVGTGRLAQALAQAQAKFGIADLDRTNPHFNSRYASLASIMRAVQPHLGEAGVAIVQMPSIRGNDVVLTTRLIHSSGEYVESTLSAPVPQNRGNPVQGMASVLTYLRRYALSAMLGVATGEDDDGNSNDSNPAPAKAQQPPAERAGKEERAKAMDRLHGVAKTMGIKHDDLRGIAGVESITDLHTSALHGYATLLSAQDLSVLRTQWDGLTSDDRVVLAAVKDWCKRRLDDAAPPTSPAPEQDPTPTLEAADRTTPILEVPQSLKPGVCKGCHKDILWGLTQGDKSVPVDLPILRAVEGEAGREDKRYILNRSGKLTLVKTWHPQPGVATMDVYMPHHATCPDVNLFRKSQQQEATA